MIGGLLAQEGTGELASLAESIAALTGPAVLALVLVLLLTGHLVTRGQLRELERDRDTWQRIALQAIDLGEAAVRRGEHHDRGGQ